MFHRAPDGAKVNGREIGYPFDMLHKKFSFMNSSLVYILCTAIAKCKLLLIFIEY